jgi:signal transduction histidine kinase
MDLRLGTPLRYAIAVAAVAVALGLKYVFTGDHPFVFLPAAVVVAAWSGGRGPGLLAVILAAVGADILFIPPTGIGFESDDVLPFFALLIEAMIIVEITVRMRAAEERARREAEAAEAARRELTLALKMREELLAFWSEKLHGPLTGLVSGLRAARTALEQGNDARALVALDGVVGEVWAVQRTAEQWADREGKEPPAT